MQMIESQIQIFGSLQLIDNLTNFCLLLSSQFQRTSNYIISNLFYHPPFAILLPQRMIQPLSDYSTDDFEIDSITFGKSKQFPVNQQQQFPFRIGSSFIDDDQDDFQLSAVSDSHNMSFDDIINQRIAKQKNNIQDLTKKYPIEQIMKINKLNSKVKTLIVIENEINHQIKSSLNKFFLKNKNKQEIKNTRKDLSQFLRKKLNNFQKQLSQVRIQSFKINRIAKIPAEKRACFLNNKDKKEVKKRKYIKVLISEKNKELQIKTGLIQPHQSSLPKIKEQIKQYEEYIKQSVSLIDDSQMRSNINNKIFNQLSQFGQKLKNSSANNKQQILNLNKKIGQMVEFQLKAKKMIDKEKIIQGIQLEKKVIESSENLLALIPSKRYFSLMPNFNKESMFKF